MNAEIKNRLDMYRELIASFVEGQIDARRFEASFLDMSRSETIIFPDNIHVVLNDLFADVDAYCDDPSIRDDLDIDEKGLVDSVQRALNRLNKEL